MRVGFPATVDSTLLDLLPTGIELIPLNDGLDHEIEIDVWIPDPYPTRALRIWPHLKGVRLILSLMAGTDWITDKAGPDVTVCNARAAHNVSTAEWTISAILAMLKQFPLFLGLQRSADWRGRKEATVGYERITGDARHLHPPVMLEELTGKRVLLVGYGAIGTEIERMLAPFHVDLVRVARRPRIEPLVHSVKHFDQLLPDAEIIILILPLNDASRGLVGPRQLALMRQGALLVNAARGAIVQTEALLAALNEGRIRAALDVTHPEPLPHDHPLWRCPNLLITPHVAGSSPQFAPRAMKVAAEELKRYLNGEPLQNVVQYAGE
ncbi:NAD(P)-dependent oxidoreductase [Occallatibacter riparius]|uniref:Hydroxyacid dehydrogenase n=1 Tax=Occallatibacter riparius TaxID=1002689 RepID=A0A9J7BW19_9BACT|nr:NAD(P)-dependent oxidoreductase [Occallatibacter riparius]UWZ85086.1 hydroxyacid dehydrogenase [Occallatibacter riparius]